MPRAEHYHRRNKAELAAAVAAWRQHNENISAAAEALGISHSTVGRRLARAAEAGLMPYGDLPQTAIAQARNATVRSGGKFAIFDQPSLPSEIAPVEELFERREKEYERIHTAEEARRLIPIKIKIKGPVGIVHFGDPHIDDPGTDIKTLRNHVEIVNRTEGLVAANVGDMQNNWIGRLAHLYGQQSTSAAESWVLTDWLVTVTKWLYLIGGNHDCWSGAGDPLKWIAAHHGQTYEAWGARLNLIFPNGKQIRVNARHDFAGHSMWNTAHGPGKAVQMGWRDHILTCGHKHTSGYMILKDPASGLVSHALRIAGYKILDRYAKQLGLPNQNITPAVTTVIDPRFDDDDPRLITVLNDVEEAADFLTFKRQRAAA